MEGEIFDYTKAKPSYFTEEYDEFSKACMDVSFSNLHLTMFQGCSWKMLNYKTFIYEIDYDYVFKILSACFEFKWRDDTVYVNLTCPYSEHLFVHPPNIYVRLFTKHPVTGKTIYTYMNNLMSYKFPEYIFMFLKKDYMWFENNIQSIKTNLEEEKVLNLNTIDYITDGMRISSYLVKDLFK